MSKVALITGASSGIGRATAEVFARQGYRLALAARSPEPLTEAAIALEKTYNGDVLLAPTDMTDAEQVLTLVEKTLERFEQVDVLVNNAGICATGPFGEMGLEQWRQVMDVNFWGYVYAIRAVLPHMLEKGRGQIVNVGSFGGKMPLPNMTAYCASKYAVAGLTESLRLEVELRGVEAIAVHPGVVKTDFLDRALFVGKEAGEARRQMEQAVESFMSQRPQEVAEAIWDACRTGKKDVVVGPMQAATAAYQLFPGLVGPLMGRNS